MMEKLNRWSLPPKNGWRKNSLNWEQYANTLTKKKENLWAQVTHSKNGMIGSTMNGSSYCGHSVVQSDEHISSMHETRRTFTLETQKINKESKGDRHSPRLPPHWSLLPIN